MKSAPSVRMLAVEALSQWEKGHSYAESLVHQKSLKHQLSQEDRNLLNAMLVDTIRHLRKIDFWISQLRQKKLDELTRNILRIGLCQLHVLEIPAHAAVNETVKVAKKSTRGLINAILRKSLREAEPLSKLTAQQSLGVRFSHPDWLVKKWQKAYGDEATEKLLKWNQVPAPTIFRLNILKENVHHLPSELDTVKTIPGFPDFFVSDGLPPQSWIQDGLIYIQDPATSHSVELLAPMPGEIILDACAAPGGKSTQIAAHMQNAGQLICTDSNEKRLPRLSENLKRLGVTHASVEEWDWSNPAPARFHQKFSGILLDVPCSNTGVLRRRIDARWRLKASDFTSLNRIQLQLLENAIPCLRPNGRIVYSTCSIDSEENGKLVQMFLLRNPQFQLISEHQSTPFTDATDGAYAALLRLKAET